MIGGRSLILTRMTSACREFIGVESGRRSRSAYRAERFAGKTALVIGARPVRYNGRLPGEVNGVRPRG